MNKSRNIYNFLIDMILIEVVVAKLVQSYFTIKPVVVFVVGIIRNHWHPIVFDLKVPGVKTQIKY
jgi:hypothetical protein